jgi:hypothetical protein
LNISYNRITDAGAEHLSEYLKNASCNLKYLDLSYNDITPSGIHAIADALQVKILTIKKIIIIIIIIIFNYEAFFRSILHWNTSYWMDCHWRGKVV